MVPGAGLEPARGRPRGILSPTDPVGLPALQRATQCTNTHAGPFGGAGAGQVFRRSNECPICSCGMRTLLELPQYPLTELYEPCDAPYVHGRALVDQTFLFCPECSHGKLEAVVPPDILYGSAYRTRTAASSGALRAVHGFSTFVHSRVDLAAIDVVIDIGGNDGSLLDTFADRLQKVAVDPNAEGERAIRAFVEDADLTPFKGKRKLILSSHTIEHIERPAAMMEKIAGILHYGDTVAMQFPSLERLVLDHRIDHIHHQHVHYYSERSISLLLAQYGMEITAVQVDHMHYGSLMVLARRGKREAPAAIITEPDIWTAEIVFRNQLDAIPQPDSFVAFGAALMLPILGYYLPWLEQAEYIADNDASKHGLRYVNFNKCIRRDHNLTGRDVVITGIATKMAARKLTTLAFEHDARNVIVPLHTL